MYTVNGTGGSTATARTISGRGLSHRRLDARQRAAIAADVLAGLAVIKPTARQVADMFGVSVAYIGIAKQLSPAKRRAIASGKDSTSFVALLNPPAERLALPAPTASIDDATLANVVQLAGIDRVLAAAVSVEQNGHAAA
jgi:hypothetical protein